MLQPSQTAALDAQLLLAHVLSRPRVWVLSHPDAPMGERHRSAFGALIERRSSGEPVAYLRGWVEWHGLRFDVSPDVLIPRPETELLLERAAELASRDGWSSIADIGTGSGAVAVGLATMLPDARIQATDTSAAALAVARGNAERNDVAARVTFSQGDLIEPLREPPDLIVANLPYLSDEMMDSLDVDVRHEPATALHGGSDGLQLLRRLRDSIRIRGWHVPLLLEYDPRQSDSVRSLFRHDGQVEIFRDYAGHDRMVWVQPEGR
jgi:release factor glutamine methyltransferase